MTLEERRQAKNLTFREIAERTGIDYTSVHFHHSRNRCPSLRDAVRYAELYGVTEREIYIAWEQSSKANAQ